MNYLETFTIEELQQELDELGERFRRQIAGGLITRARNTSHEAEAIRAEMARRDAEARAQQEEE